MFGSPKSMRRNRNGFENVFLAICVRDHLDLVEFLNIVLWGDVL